MPDYNLGRAHGEISITADTRGAQQAQAAMAATAGEAAALDATMGRVNDQFAANQRQNVSTAEAITRHRQQVEDLQRTYQRYYDEYNRAVTRTREAEDALTRARDDENTKQNTMLRLARDVERSRDAEERLLLRVTQAQDRYQTRLAAVSAEVARFNEVHIQASSSLNRMRLEAERVGESLESLSGKLTSILRIVGQGGIMGLLGLGSAGTTAAMGAGGLGGVTSVIAGVIEAVQQLSGVVALMPAIMGAGAVALGTLATAFQGVGKAISSMGDPGKFLDSLKDLAPAARQTMIVFYSFQDAIRGVRFAIQEATFEPFVAQLQPVIRTWLPLLQEAGRAVGSQFGQMASQVLGFMQTLNAQQGFQQFVRNMVVGMQQASHAIQPLLQAFQTLSVVGSSFFGRIGNAITNLANEFNTWVQAAAANGRLQAWINSALTGFTNLGHTILNVAEAVANIFAIGDKYGGGFLGFIRNLSQEFVAWTQSARGIETISNFFNLLRAAGQAMSPILHIIGEGLAVVAGALTRLGIQIAPAVTVFFQSILGALRALAPVVQQSGPAISQFIVVLGRALLQIVQEVGPQLPKIFEGLSNALVLLLPILPRLIGLLAAVLDHLSSTSIQNIFLAALAVKGLAVAFGIFTAALDLNPITLAIAAIALLAAGVVAAITNFHGFGDEVSAALRPLDELAGKAYDWGKNLITNFARGISEWLRPLDDVVGNVAQTVTDFLKQRSPARRGPLSEMSTEEMGARAAQGYASGIAGGAGAVETASSGVAGRVAGTTGLGFTSSGAAGRSGAGVQGHSGFDQYISFLTNDLTAWNNIFRESFQLFQNTANTVVQTIKVAASLWNRGDNPLTRPGGIAGPPVLWGQQNVPGVQNVQAPGKAPLPDLVPPGPTPGQQTVPGVQNVGPPNPRMGDQPGPGSAGGGFGGAAGTSVGAAPPNAPSAAAGAPPITVNPDGTVSSPNPAWQHLLTRESGGRNILQGDIPGDPNTGPNKAQGYFQITPDTWRRHGGEEFAPNPMAASPQQQAIVAGRILQNEPGAWGYGRHPDRENPADLRAGLTPAGGPQPAAAPPAPQPSAQPAAFQSVDMPSPNRGGQINPNLFLVHTEEGQSNARQLAQSMVGSGNSYNYIIDPSGNLVVNAVPAGTQAESVSSPGNQRSINAVIAGSTVNWTREQWLQHMPALQTLATIAARDTQRFGIPQQLLQQGSQAGIGGHDWVSRNLGGTDHTDPGPNFPWDVFIPLVQGGGRAPQPGAPQLTGAQQPAGAAGGPIPGAAVNPATRANFPLGGTTTDAFRAAQRAGTETNPPLYPPGTNSGGYGSTQGLPPWAVEMGRRFGLVPSTYPTGGTLHQAGYALDFVPIPGTPRDVGIRQMDAFADFIKNNLTPQTLELIHANSQTGQKWGIAGGQDVSQGSYFADDWAGHDDYGTEPHVHWATDVPPILPGINAPLSTAPGAGGGGVGGQLSARATVGGPFSEFGTGGLAITAALGIGAGVAGYGAYRGGRAAFSRLMGPPSSVYRQQLEAIRGLSPEDMDFIGRNPQFRFATPGAGINGLNLDLSGPTGGLRYGAFDTGLGPLQGPEVPPGFGPFEGPQLPGTGERGITPLRYRPLFEGPILPRQGQILGPGPLLRPVNAPATVTGDSGGALRSIGRGIGGAADAAAIPLLINQAGQVADQQRGRGWLGPATGIAGPVILGGGAAAGAAAAGVLGPSLLGAGILGAVSTATGAATGQESTRTPGVIYGPNGQVISAGPQRTGIQGTPPANPPAQTQGSSPSNAGQFTHVDPNQLRGPLGPAGPGPTRGLTGLDRFGQELVNRRAAIGADTATGQGGPVPVNVTHQAGVPVDTPAQQRQIALRDQQTPTGPRVLGPPSQSPFAGRTGSQGTPGPQPPGGDQPQAGQPGYINYGSVYDPNNNAASSGKLPFNAQTPLDAFTSGLAAAGNLAGDAFQVFGDIIQNISATAHTMDTLVRGPQNTEDIVGMIKDFQTYLKTAADVAKTVGDVGSMVGGASGGMDFGGGAALQAIAGIVSSAISGINDAITVGIDVYHEVGKYAGYIFGEFLGGGATGPLGGNVRMLLNTRTNQLYTYSQDNPLNKNTLDVPLWQRSYAQQATPPTTPAQINFYAGPGQSPQQFMSDSMYAVGVGNAATASVSGRD